MTFMPLNTFQASSDLILTWPHFLTRTLTMLPGALITRKEKEGKNLSISFLNLNPLPLHLPFLCSLSP